VINILEACRFLHSWFVEKTEARLAMRGIATATGVEEEIMSAQHSFKSELGNLAPPVVRAGVLLASIANNVLANPRNAAIIAALVLFALPICWLWKRRGSNHERFRLQRYAETSQDGLLDAARKRPDLRTARAAVVDQHKRVLIGDSGIAFAESLEAAGFDQPGCRQLRLSVR
jgi:hypothetical protein